MKHFQGHLLNQGFYQKQSEYNLNSVLTKEIEFIFKIQLVFFFLLLLTLSYYYFVFFLFIFFFQLTFGKTFVTSIFLFLISVLSIPYIFELFDHFQTFLFLFVVSFFLLLLLVFSFMDIYVRNPPNSIHSYSKIVSHMDNLYEGIPSLSLSF